MNPHTPKWIPILGIRVPMDSQIFRKCFEGLKLIGLKKILYIENLLRLKCLKLGCIIHLNTYNTSYGRKKGQESKCQFDSRSLKVRNRLKLNACRKRATCCWKLVDEGYNFALDLSSIGSLHKKLQMFKVTRVLILKFLRLLTWES